MCFNSLVTHREQLPFHRSDDPFCARPRSRLGVAIPQRLRWILKKSRRCRDELKAAKNDYWATEVEVMRLASVGWVSLAQKNNNEALETYAPSGRD
jgi:hypothetical protein